MSTLGFASDAGIPRSSACGRRGSIYVEGQEADRLKLKYDRISHDSLNAKDSLELIAAVADSISDA
ncbi:hypothetical protein AB0L53_34650 [Nonomuraea sp. NPDC052129]|uniref:hypothetical protein n=1 Tax=Nonomuraea sp. NPDC052129 TaxID=3154651 RepID=UPI003413AFA6